MAILPLRNATAWSLGICLVAALLEAALSGAGIRGRFSALRLPKPSPPLWMWPVIGGAYYVLYFFLIRSLLSQPATTWRAAAALLLTSFMLAANAGWNWIFFRKKDLRLSFVYFIPYWLAALALETILTKLGDRLSGWYALYLAYLLYASWWGYQVWRINSSSGQKG
jgi:tryptophan-rich sensory protein